MTTKPAVFILGLALTLAAGRPALAHHTVVAIYDSEKPVTVTGSVTRFDWRNPHVFVYVDVKDADGKVANWRFELNGVNVLTRAGWTRDSLKYGDVVTVEGNRARDGSEAAVARSIV